MKETLGYSSSLKSSSRKPLKTDGDARLSIAVLGKSRVGKTALTVQYLTGRFIGDYCSGQNMTYRASVPYLGGSLSIPVDILDTSNNATAAHYDFEWDRMNEDSYWAAQHSQSMFNSSEDSTNSTGHHQHRQAYLVVYSLTDSDSFDLAKEILQILPSTAPKYLAANQLDLQHRREISREEGQALADRFDLCYFGEFSAANPSEDSHYGRHIKFAFGKLIRQLISSSPQCVLAPYFPRISFSVFSKLLRALAVIKMRHKLRKMTLMDSSLSFPINMVTSSI